MRRIFCLLLLTGIPLSVQAQSGKGYYRFPAIHGDTIVFAAEGDLWKVSAGGGVAVRLTSHPGEESSPALSPDGKALAFSAQYEGPTEVYTMPVDGGLPTRKTFEGGRADVVGWLPDGRILYSTSRFSTLPDDQLAALDPKTGKSTLFPLAQASSGTTDPSGKYLFFTRLPFQGSQTKRYQGGTAQNLWKFMEGQAEAVPLTGDYPGTSKDPMWWKNRIYFVSDRDGTMNLWSMREDGRDLLQLTKHKGWDVKSPSLSNGRIVYQLGADLHLYDIAGRKDTVVEITLASDLDQMREKWVRKPMDYLTAAHISSDGDRVVLTARGKIFVAPAQKGRFVEATRKNGVRYRGAQFMPDGKSLLALADETGELEFCRIPANGVGDPDALTSDGKVFRFDGVPSPDGKRIAYADKDYQLWIFDIEQKKQTRIAVGTEEGFSDLKWSPDSRWLAYVSTANNSFQQIMLYRLDGGSTTTLTSERNDSYSPSWSADGKWIYFFSDRNLESVVGSPWGPRQPEPFFDKTTKLYMIGLTKDQRSPFLPPDELHPAEPEKKEAEAAKPATGEAAAKPPVQVTIDLEGIQARLQEVPVAPGNYSSLTANDKRLFWFSRDTSTPRKRNLVTIDITNKEPKLNTLMEDAKDYELSLDGKKMLLLKGEDFYVIDASSDTPAKLENKKVNLQEWTFSLIPQEEWRQMFVEAWRLERDYFYDRNMHGVDWPGLLKKYRPLVDRVTTRGELSDLVEQLVGELSALHIFVVGGDYRKGPDEIAPAYLGAALTRDESAGGYLVSHIYKSEPDFPDGLSPLAKPGVGVREGDIIQAINGVPALSVPDPAELLRNKAGKQVLLSVKSPGAEKSRTTLVSPVSTDQESDLRYDEWEYTRRLRVEELGKGDVGYVHLRAMGGNNYAEWARNFFPVFNRKGLIIDVRHNRGGNIDSWILEKLLRKAWFYWQPRVGNPTWNMQYAFRGHMVVLCDEHTASDGEAFTEGFRRLGLGKVIGTRTWGGEIWLSFSNWLVDKGIASAAEIGVFGPEGKWLIEGHGVDPDVVVDNLPHATFGGQDAQLEAAVKYLQEQIRLKPVTVPAKPPYPDKSLK